MGNLTLLSFARAVDSWERGSLTQGISYALNHLLCKPAYQNSQGV
jgi:hypothetical protein